MHLPFSVGYGVEIAMLIDAWRGRGLDGLAQVHLGSRQNAHQALRALSAMGLRGAGRRLDALPRGRVRRRPRLGLNRAAPQELDAPMEMRRVPIEERPSFCDSPHALGELRNLRA